MKTNILKLFSLFMLISCKVILAQDTFSIVAVDSLTGEIGSAGASCVQANINFPRGAVVISSIFPGRGAINSQASLILANKATAETRMQAGDSPKEIIEYLKKNDFQNDSTPRQYGVVDFDSNKSPRSASYTGSKCLSYANHYTGNSFSVQGNILLGKEIIDTITHTYQRTKGDLADRLMAAIYAAKIVGADTRCAVYGTSSLSAFIRVAKPTDNASKLTLDIATYSLPNGVDPLDSLKVRYERWKVNPNASINNVNTGERIRNAAEVIDNGTDIIVKGISNNAKVRLTDLQGKIHFKGILSSTSNSISNKFNSGFYMVQIEAEGGKTRDYLIFIK